jgi:signal transduction histidine kinase
VRGAALSSAVMDTSVGPGRRDAAVPAARRLLTGAASGIATVLWGRVQRDAVLWPRGSGGVLLRVLYGATVLWSVAYAVGVGPAPFPGATGQAAIMLLTGVAMAVAPRWPVTGWRIVMAAQVGVLLLPRVVPFSPPVGIGVAGVLVVIGLRCPPRVAASAGVLSVLVGVLVATINTDGGSRTVAVLVLVPLLLAVNGRARRVAAVELAAGQRQAAEALAERAVLTERARIAREMHDVVAHHMSLVIVRCETAPYRVSGLGAPASRELGEVAAAAREAMTEMQALLGVLRSDEQVTARAPQPGLDQLPALLAETGASGVDLTWSVTVDQREVPTAVGLTVFRIVQQALSNAAQHARGAPLAVLVERSDTGLRVDVRNGPGDGGTSGTTAGGGLGLIGMRERAQLHGGRLDAGPTGDGGFAVSADLPLPAGLPA